MLVLTDLMSLFFSKVQWRQIWSFAFDLVVTSDRGREEFLLMNWFALNRDQFHPGLSHRHLTLG